MTFSRSIIILIFPLLSSFLIFFLFFCPKYWIFIHLTLHILPVTIGRLELNGKRTGVVVVEGGVIAVIITITTTTTITMIIMVNALLVCWYI